MPILKVGKLLIRLFKPYDDIMNVRNIVNVSTEILENLFCFGLNIKLKMYIVPLTKVLSLENDNDKITQFRKTFSDYGV